jgi:hypothetical protein
LIFIPNDGFQIQLGVSIADFAFGGGGTATAVRQDAAFTGGTTTTSTFSEVTTSTNTGITRINQAPLLIRLANLTQVDISTVSTSVDAYSITLNMKGTYDHVVIARNNMVVATNVTGTSYIDICLNSVTTYNYTITPYNSKNMPGTPYTLSATTISPIKKWVNIGPAGGINLTSSSGGRNVYTVYYDASYDTVWVGGSFVTSYQYLIYNTSGQGWNQGPPPPGGQSKWTDYYDSGVHVITKLNGHLFVGTSGCATNLMEIANNNSLISALNGSNPGNASCYSIAWNGQQLGTTPGANYYYVGSGNQMYNFVGNWDHHLSNNNIAGGSYVVCNTQTNTLYVHGNNCSYNCDVRNSDGWGHYYSPAVYNLNNYNQANKYFQPFPLNGWVHALYYDYNTNAVYAGGEFTYACPYNQSSGTYVKGVAMSVNNGPWLPMGKGLNSWTNSFAADPRTGIIYAGGQFTADGSGNPLNHIAKYANGTWSQVGSGLNAPVYGLYFDTSCNFLYAAGNFTADGSGNAMYNIAKFDVT